jgi:hypothetical protein
MLDGAYCQERREPISTRFIRIQAHHPLSHYLAFVTLAMPIDTALLVNYLHGNGTAP